MARAASSAPHAGRLRSSTGVAAAAAAARAALSCVSAVLVPAKAQSRRRSASALPVLGHRQLARELAVA